MPRRFRGEYLVCLENSVDLWWSQLLIMYANFLVIWKREIDLSFNEGHKTTRPILFSGSFSENNNNNKNPEDHWSCIAHLNAEDMLKSAIIEEKKFKNIESE